MSFLTPMFLLGALAIAGPLIFHLIRRTTRERKVFGSLMFLMPTPPRLTRRSRLENILLLVLRCGVICLLALGFARPLIKKAASAAQPAGPAKRLVVLIDTSASMRRANLWAKAQEKAASILRSTSAADQAAIFTFDRQVNPVVSFEQWNQTAAGERVPLALRSLAGMSPGWSATQVGNALIAAAEALADPGNKASATRSQIVLISDMQEGSRLETLQGYEWPRNIELSVEPLKADKVSNAGLQLVTEGDEAGTKTSATVRVRVSNAADAKRDQFKVGWGRSDGKGLVEKASEVYVPAGQSRIVALSPPASGSPVDRILLEGDDENFDNTVYVTPPETARVNVVYLGPESETDSKQPLYFLRRAFQETRRQAVRVRAHSATSPLPATEAQDATLFVVADSLPEEQARALHEQIVAGKTLLFSLTTSAAAPTLARMLGLGSLKVEEARPNNYAMLGEIDFRDALFAPFADPRFSDFTKIHFWRYRRLDPTTISGARVLAKFDNGDPALLEVKIGKGRALILTSGWHPEDSQLALSTKFVPLLYSMLEQCGASGPPPIQYFVGETVSLIGLAGESEAANSPRVLRMPDGSQTDLPPGQTDFSQTAMPGVYELASTQPPKRFAINLDPAESRTAPMPTDELERLGAPVSRQAPAMGHEAERKVALRNAEIENRQKLWRWFLVGTLAVLLVETWLAGRTMRATAQRIGTS